jgi:hypothetical protein
VNPRRSRPGAFDPMHVSLAFDELVAWRATVGDPANDLRVQWSTDHDGFIVEWDEPGASAARPEVAARVTPDLGPDLNAETPEAESLAALTLPLLVRVMRSHGGTALATGSDRWGLTLRWPLDARPKQQEAAPC